MGEETTRMEESKVIIVGCGTSGIATAACLRKQSIPFILLDRHDCFASLWQKFTYDRLHLHLAKSSCQLPFLPFPSSYPRYVPKSLFLHYLQNYLTHFDIHPLYNRAVELAEYHDHGEQKWRVTARNTVSGQVQEYAGRFLVVATGETAEPRLPEVQGLEGFKGKLIHSTAYKNGKEFSNEHVLVVGSGNSGMEIALDLANHAAKPSIIVRSPVHVLSREMMYYATLLMKYVRPSIVEKLLVIASRIVYGDLSKYGIPSPTDGPFTTKQKYRKFPIIDLGTVQKIKSGHIQVLGAEIETVRGNQVVFKDGKSLPFDSIIFCTGFKRSTQNWLKLGDDDILDKDGFAKQWKGKKGLYCVGLAQRGFFGANLEAQNIANDIASVINSPAQQK